MAIVRIGAISKSGLSQKRTPSPKLALELADFAGVWQSFMVRPRGLPYIQEIESGLASALHCDIGRGTVDWTAQAGAAA